MRQKDNYFSILVYVGLIWCAVSALYMTGQYFAFSSSEVVAQALEPTQDIVLEKITYMPENKAKMEMILNELKSRHEQISKLHTSLTNLTSDAKGGARDGVLLWVGVLVIFVFLAINPKFSK